MEVISKDLIKKNTFLSCSFKDSHCALKKKVFDAHFEAAF